MTIYEHYEELSVDSGGTASNTLKCPGGLIQSIFIKSSNPNTTFKASLNDQRGNTRISYDYSTGEINDNALFIPMVGSWTVNITNVSAYDTFEVTVAVQEGAH